jgi:hypothetical protein
MRNVGLALLTFLLAGPLLGASHAAWIDAGAPVYFLDAKNGNFLFRGHAPLAGNPPAFDYPDLVADIKDAAAGHGKFPAKFYLVDVSLLEIQNSCGDPNDDRGRLQAEFDFFNQNPKSGEFHNWQTDGIQIDATSATITPQFQTYLVHHLDSWLPDKLSARVEQLHEWLLHGIKGVKLPVVIYIHCVGGCDRTGEMSGAYGLRYLHLSWKQMNEVNQEDCYGNKQPMGCGNYYAAHWYCYYLNWRYGRKLDCATPWTTGLICNGPPNCNGPGCPAHALP